MKKARKCLSCIYADIQFTRCLTSPACPGNGVYSNMLAKINTNQTEQELVSQLKQLEQEMGDTTEQRKNGIVMMDLDILRYNKVIRHEDDWQRDYIKRLLRYTMRTFFVLLTIIFFHLPSYSFSIHEHNNVSDADLLAKAIEYYQGGKYHESILTFEKLGRTYRLNPRFTAYLGMSYYKEMQYEEAAKCLKRCLPELQAYSPHEQAVYAYSCAESLFQLERYTEAIEYYEQALPLVSGNDRGDVLFHNAFAHYLTQGETPEVVRLFSEALSAYKADAANATSLQVARLKQTETMLRGMKK